MKLKSSLFIALTAMIALNSCEKDNKLAENILQEETEIQKSIILPDSIQVNVDNGILSFENEESLQKCIDYLSAIGDDKFDAFETALGYTSYRTNCIAKSELYLVDDDLLGTLMNQRRQVIVAGYLLTTNIKEKTTTITPPHNNLKSTSGLLDEEMTVDWKQNIYQVIETGSTQAYLKSYCGNTDVKKEWRCIPAGAASDASRIQAKVCFQRAGWYNSIIIKFKLEERQSGGLYYKLHYVTEGAMYNPNNGRPKEINRENSITAHFQGDEISHRPYSSTVRVEDANVPVWFDYEGFTDSEHINMLEHDRVLLVMNCN